MFKISRCTKAAVTIIAEMGFSIETVSLSKTKVVAGQPIPSTYKTESLFPWS
jgi:hypothetical protein